MTIFVPYPAYAMNTRQLLVSSQIYFFNIIYILKCIKVLKT